MKPETQNNNNGKKLQLQEFYGSNNLYEIRLSSWREGWGNPPVLGYVRADSEFYARYAAFDKGLVPTGSPADVMPMKVDRPSKKSVKPQYTKKDKTK